jgi:hypothetical protein
VAAGRFNLRGAWVHDDVANSAPRLHTLPENGLGASTDAPRMSATSDWVLLSRNDRVFEQADIAAHLRSLDSGARCGYGLTITATSSRSSNDIDLRLQTRACVIEREFSGEDLIRQPAIG